MASYTIIRAVTESLLKILQERRMTLCLPRGGLLSYSK